LLTNLVVVKAGVVGLDFALLILAVKDVGIRGTRNLLKLRRGLRRHNSLLGIPDGNFVDHDKVRLNDFLGTENPDLVIVCILGIHYILAQEVSNAILNLGLERHELVHLIIHDDDVQLVPMSQLGGETIPVSYAHGSGHSGTHVRSDQGRHVY
ncbi:uncharacterized protein B0T15DRAFT_521515, partial [Chaetomium strumarium]